jgi:hypothetical protein
MKRTEALAYLTRCADDNGTHWSGGRSYPAEDCPTCKGSNDAGWLDAPSSRYGRTSADIAPFVYHVAVAEGDTSEAMLDNIMRMAVNDSGHPQRWLEQYAADLAGADIDAMVTGYLECQLWAQRDHYQDEDGNSPMLDENYSINDVSADYIESVRDELAALVTEHPLAVRMYLNARERNGYDCNELFGYDYYLTREHHGAGFWDRGLGDLGEYLTKISHWAGAATDLWDNGNGELTA